MIFQLEKITVQEFYSLEDEDLVKKYFTLESIMKVKDDRFGKFKATPLGELGYGQVMDIKDYLHNPTFQSVFECFNIVYGVKLNEYLNMDIVSYFYALKWIKQEVTIIFENRKKVLTPLERDYYLEMAGAERLNVFGEFATLLTLGRSFGLDPEIIEKWKYNKVFSILAYDKIHGEVQKRYNQLKSKAK